MKKEKTEIIKKIAITVSIIVLVVILLGIFGIYYLFTHMFSSTPHTDRTKIKTEMMSYAESKYDNDLKFKKFKVSADNNLEGVPGSHTLIMKTQEGYEVSFYIDNDMIDENSNFDIENVSDDYITSLLIEKGDKKIRDLYPELEEYLSHDFIFEDDKVRMSISYDNGYASYYEPIEESAKKEGLLIGDYMRKHEKEIIKQFVSIDVVLYPENGAKNVKQEYKDEFYDVYKILTSKFDDSFIINMTVEDYNDGEGNYVDFFDKETKTVLTKEEVMDRFENYDNYKQDVVYE